MAIATSLTLRFLQGKLSHQNQFSQPATFCPICGILSHDAQNEYHRQVRKRKNFTLKCSMGARFAIFVNSKGLHRWNARQADRSAHELTNRDGSRAFSAPPLAAFTSPNSLSFSIASRHPLPDGFLPHATNRTNGEHARPDKEENEIFFVSRQPATQVQQTVHYAQGHDDETHQFGLDAPPAVSSFHDGGIRRQVSWQRCATTTASLPQTVRQPAMPTRAAWIRCPA